jgi:glutathione S-transferase
MSTPILHHYDLSPYAEKARLMLGFKALAWKSVMIPMVMPKPDLTCLTGGYRKTPVLQIGADIFCDTKTIARALEMFRPRPTLFPPCSDASERALSSLGDTMFLAAVTVLRGAGFFPQPFIEDRQKLFGSSFDADETKLLVPTKRDQLRAALVALERQLADGRPFLLGDEASLADFSIYNPVSFMPLAPPTAVLLSEFSRVLEWRDSIAAIGHGDRTEMSAEEAIEEARRSVPAPSRGVDPREPNGYRAGDRITVMPEDYGRDPVTGELVGSDPFEISLLRVDPRAGEIVVHFPREGYVVAPAAVSASGKGDAG